MRGRPNICQRCGKHKRRGSFCARCMAFLRRRHKRWAATKPGKRQGRPTVRKETPQWITTCLDVDGSQIYTPCIDVRLNYGFLLLSLTGDM